MHVDLACMHNILHATHPHAHARTQEPEGPSSFKHELDLLRKYEAEGGAVDDVDFEAPKSAKGTRASKAAKGTVVSSSGVSCSCLALIVVCPCTLSRKHTATYPSTSLPNIAHSTPRTCTHSSGSLPYTLQTTRIHSLFRLIRIPCLLLCDGC